MYLAAFAREPDGEELKFGEEFLGLQAKEYGLTADSAARDERVWADFAHVLFNVKEFVFVQ